jgi:hypothetical protein
MKDLFGHDKVEEAIKLTKVVYDIRARDGMWCKLPYPGHPKGCPNFPACPATYFDFLDSSKVWTHWYAVIEEFDLVGHKKKMKQLHPLWTDRQCRNPLYWQNGVRSKLNKKALAVYKHGDTILEIPEACGINVFETMAKVGINIERYPDIVRKIMLIGKTSTGGRIKYEGNL